MRVRDLASKDIAAVVAIYAHHVMEGLGSFEEVAPDEGEMTRRIDAVHAFGLPWLVAESDDGAVAGFAYASPFRTRAGYRHTVEDSVYVAPGAQGRGVGRLLLNALISACEAHGGLRQLMAVIGDSHNAASIGLHRAAGFELVGTARGVGFKHGRWVDVVWMRRPLGVGDASPPDMPGLAFGEP